MKPFLKYHVFWFLIVCSGILSGCHFNQLSKNKVRIPPLTPKYNFRDSEPMGSYIAYHYISSLFQNGVQPAEKKSFYEHWYNLAQDSSLYIILARTVFLGRYEINAMMNYVSNGNTMFISAAYLDEKLLDTLGVDMNPDWEQVYYLNEYRLDKHDTWVTVTEPGVQTVKKYGFYFTPFTSGFMFPDSSGIQVLGYNEERRPNLIAVNHGNGKFILHASPAAFSNYFLLQPGNAEYIEKIFSYFPAKTEAVYWDNYYRSKTGGDNFSIVEFFKKHPPLFFAFLLALALLLLFLSFGGKRKQRFVEEKFPVQNVTVTYAETIGRLYLQKKDNRNMAGKMITYFLEFVRNHYYLNTQILNNEFATALAKKSGQPESSAHRLLQLMRDLENEEQVSNLSLLELQNQIEEFTKK